MSDPYPNDPPDTPFGAHLRRTKGDLPNRYRKPGYGAGPRLFVPSRLAGYGIPLVIVAAFLAWAFGWTTR